MGQRPWLGRSSPESRCHRPEGGLTRGEPRRFFHAGGGKAGRMGPAMEGLRRMGMGEDGDCCSEGVMTTQGMPGSLDVREEKGRD